MCDNLVRAQFQIGKFSERRLQRADKFCFQLAIQLITRILLLHIAADIGIKQHRIRDFIGINAGTADGDIHIQPDLGVYYTERDRVRRAKLVVDQFFGIKVIHPLILPGITSKGEPLANRLKRPQYAAAKASGKNARLCGRVILKFPRLCAQLHNLALFYNHHALSVSDRNHAAI